MSLVTTADNDNYILVNDEDADNHRRIPVFQYELLWDHSERTCYYAGNSQGGPEFSTNPRESVIEGVQSDYKTDTLFDATFKFEMFEESFC